MGPVLEGVSSLSCCIWMAETPILATERHTGQESVRRSLRQE